MTCGLAVRGGRRGLACRVAAPARSQTPRNARPVDGTRVRLRLAQVISSETSTPRDVVGFHVIQDVVVDGVVVIAHGTPVTGRIVTWPLCRSCISTYRAHRWEHLSRRITVIAV